MVDLDLLTPWPLPWIFNKAQWNSADPLSTAPCGSWGFSYFACVSLQWAWPTPTRSSKLIQCLSALLVCMATLHHQIKWLSLWCTQSNFTKKKGTTLAKDAVDLPDEDVADASRINPLKQPWTASINKYDGSLTFSIQQINLLLSLAPLCPFGGWMEGLLKNCSLDTHVSH